LRNPDRENSDGSQVQHFTETAFLYKSSLSNVKITEDCRSKLEGGEEFDFTDEREKTD
jgi:hypothetical protein